MVHNIYVCLEHKLTFHSLRGVGKHGELRHRVNSYLDLMAQGILVDIEECFESKEWNIKGCDLGGHPSSESELKEAEKLKEKQILDMKQEIEELRKYDVS